MAAVTLTSISTVSPATAGRQQSWAALSNHKSFFYVKDVYYFKPSCKSPFALVVEELKQSLASALSVEEYSFLAKAQVVLTIAHATARFDDWESMDRCSIRDELCKIDECSDGSPVCRIQVTQFSCGGISIGFAVLNGLASSALQFPKWWAEVNRGMTMSTPESGGDLEATSSGLVKLAKAASATIGNPVKREVLVINPCKVDDLVREIGGTPLEATSALILQCMTNKDATNKHVSEVKHCGKDVTCVSIPAYETDFGWGKPVHYSPWIGDGMVFILPREEEEGTAMEIQVQISQEQMERLLKNATLMRFATSSTRKKGGKVVILDSIDTIVPAIPTKQPCWISLTNLDKMLFKNSYLKSVHFYKTSSRIDCFNHMVSKIKDSLSKVLVDHYVFAGRLQENERGEKAVNCNDAGITLRVAHTLARLDEWEDSIEEELNAPEWLIENIPEAPFFHMQVTRFACGGIAVGQTCTELVLDGYSGLFFQKSWAEVNRGVPMSTVPVFKPELLMPREPPVVNVPVRDYVAVPPEAVESYMADTSMAAPTSYCQQVLVLTSDKAEELANEIESGPDSYGTTTSFEAVAALFWKSMTEARELTDVDTTKFAYTMSLRGGKRWQPTLPTGFFGNAVHAPSLPANAGHIRARHMSYAARLIHEDILGMSTETVKSCVDWMEIEQRKGVGVTYNLDTYGGKDVNCTSLHIFPVYDIDFGWGRPAYFSFCINAMFGDLVFILPSALGGKNREIYVQMRREHMSKLLSSSDLLRFVTPTTKKALLNR